jgi:plasmid stabilization system protein ParE
MTVVFREEALADLEEIAQYIAQHDPRAADRVVAHIHRTIYRTIAVLPLSGRLNSNQQHTRVRCSGPAVLGDLYANR